MAGRVSAGLTPAQQGRKFGLTLGLAFVVFSGLVWWRGHAPVAIGFDVVGGLLLVMALVAPQALLPIERGWMKFALALSKFTTPIFMGIVYFLVVLPIGFLVRWLKGNPLEAAQVDGSFWVGRHGDEPGRGNMHRQF